MLVLGGGPAGSALALTLAREGVSVLVVERSAYTENRVGELMSPMGVSKLRNLLGRDCEPYLLSSLSIVSAWTTDELVKGSPSKDGPWRSVDRIGLDKKIAELASLAGADLLIGEQLGDLRRTNEAEWSFKIGSHQSRATLIVDATGRAHRLAKKLGAYRRKTDDQVAIVGFLRKNPDQKIACEMLLETTQNGWWYSAPITPTSAVAVFVTDADLSKGSAPQAWKAALSESRHTRARFETCEFAEPPRRVAAENSMTFPSYGDGWVAVGDAASSTDPLSTRGIGRALSEGVELAEEILNSLQSGRPFHPVIFTESSSADHVFSLIGLRQSYRQVRQFADSIFWARRLKGRVVEGEDRETKLARSVNQDLFFAEGQNFECSKCGKCCGSEWAPEISTRQALSLRKNFRALKVSRSSLISELREDGVRTLKKDQNGKCIFLSSSNKCEIFAQDNRPTSCALFPFILRETPTGIQVGVSYLCSSIQKNTGLPLKAYEDKLRKFLSQSTPTILPKKIPVSYGRVLGWSDYSVLENILLEATSLSELERRLKAVRWTLAQWACGSDKDYPGNWSEVISQEFPDLSYLDQTLAVSCYVRMLKVDSYDAKDLDELQTDIQEASTRFHAKKNPSELDSSWLGQELLRYLKALIERKILFLRLPLLHNICLLCTILEMLLVVSDLSAEKNHHEFVEPEDYFAHLELVEHRLVTHRNEMRFTHEITKLILLKALKLQAPHSYRDSPPTSSK